MRERAVDGKANEAVRRALADAFGLRRADVRIISGASTRTKVVAMVSADPGRLEELLTDRR